MEEWLRHQTVMLVFNKLLMNKASNTPRKC